MCIRDSYAVVPMATPIGYSLSAAPVPSMTVRGTPAVVGVVPVLSNPISGYPVSAAYPPCTMPFPPSANHGGASVLRTQTPPATNSLNPFL